MQVGASAVIARDNGGATWRLGGALNVGRSRVVPDARDISRTDIDMQTLSGIATWLHPSGAYIDGLVSIGRVSADVRTDIYQGQTVASPHGRRHAVSIEGGWPIALGDSGMQIEPQVQYAWQRLRLRSFTDIDGVRYDAHAESQGVLRVGARLTRPFQTAEGTRVTPYLRLDYLHGTGGNGSARVGGVNFATGQFGSGWRVGAGVSGMLTRQLSVYADLSWQDRANGGGWRSWMFSGGLRYAFGGSNER